MFLMFSILNTQTINTVFNTRPDLSRPPPRWSPPTAPGPWPHPGHHRGYNMNSVWASQSTLHMYTLERNRLGRALCHTTTK